MIHSLSGGVLSDKEVYAFAKVDVQGTPAWYLAPQKADVGAKVIVPFGSGRAQGEVVRVEYCTRQTAPVSLSRAKSILRVVES